MEETLEVLLRNDVSCLRARLSFPALLHSPGVANKIAVARGRQGTSDLGMSTVVIPSDFRLPIGIAAVGLAASGAGNFGLGFPLTVAGLALAFQATNVAFEFDDEVGDDKRTSMGRLPCCCGCCLLYADA